MYAGHVRQVKADQNVISPDFGRSGTPTDPLTDHAFGLILFQLEQLLVNSILRDCEDGDGIAGVYVTFAS